MLPRRRAGMLPIRHAAMPPCHYHNRSAAAACDDLVVCALTSDEVWRFRGGHAGNLAVSWRCGAATNRTGAALLHTHAHAYAHAHVHAFCTKA